MLGVYFKSTKWTYDLYALSMYEEQFLAMDSIGRILMELFLIYLLFIFTYCFLVVFQYLVSQPVASIVIASLVAVTPLYLWITLFDSFYISNVGAVLPWYLPASSRCVYKEEATSMLTSYVNFIDRPIASIIGIAILCVLGAVGAYVLAKSYRIETLDCLMPKRWVRIVFVIGVTVCTTLLPRIIVEVYFYYSNGLMILGSMVISGVIGFLLSKKIASIGQKGGDAQ